MNNKYIRAVNSLERKKKELEVRRKGELDG